MLQYKHDCYGIHTPNSISAPNEMSYAKRSCFAPVFIKLELGQQLH